MKIVIYGNCQATALNKLLKPCMPESEIHVLQNFHIIRGQRDLNTDLLQSADVFVYQPIEDKHQIYSTNNLIKDSITTYLKPGCMKISFPYVYNSGLWILIPPRGVDWFESDYCDTGGNNLDSSYPKNWINMNVITDLKSSGLSIDDILNMHSTGKIDWKSKSRFDQNIKELHRREKTIDIKVADFLKNNVQHRKIMMTHNHPTGVVFKHMTDQILDILNISKRSSIENLPIGLGLSPDLWLHTSYDQSAFNFKYDADCNHDSEYVAHIKTIYNNYS